jgi:hypothetical protein
MNDTNFTTPITITVKATDSKLDSIDADPAILIRSLEGNVLTCYDYSFEYDAQGRYKHGNEEVLNTSRMNVINRFEPKRGEYWLEIWNYYQPAKQYEITITEGR